MSPVTEHVIPAGRSLAVARIETAMRLLLGALLGFSALSFFFHLAPEPEMPAPARNLFEALVATGYFLPLLKITELLVAIALLSNRFVALALVVLAPITINIVLFHAVLAPEGIVAGVILLAFHLSLAWLRRHAYRALLQPQ